MDNNNKNNGLQNKKKQLIIKKYNDIDDLLKIKERFADPNQYFIKDKRMIIGNLSLNSIKQIKNKLKIKSFSLSETLNNNNNIETKRLKNDIISKSKSYTQGQIITSSKKKSKNIPSTLSRPKTSTLSRKNNNINSNLNTYLTNLKNKNETNSGLIGIHYQTKSLSEVLNILQKFKMREEKNKLKTKYDLFLKEEKNEIRHNFEEQEKILNKNLKLKNKSDFLSKYLSKKLKRNEEELLFNKIEEYRLKRQVLDYIENSKSMRDKFGDNYWIANLRRPTIQKEIRVNYFNNGNKNNMPEKVIDYADKDVEFINDPMGVRKNKYKNIVRNLSINNLVLSRTELKFPDMEKMKEIEVIGKNLVDQEYQAILEENNYLNKNEKQFKLYKDPLETKYKNMKEFVCSENYDNKLKGYKSKSYRVNKSIKNDLNYISGNKNKKNKNLGLFRSQSQIEENKNSKNHISYLKEAVKILKKENMKKSIKIISSN